MLFDANFETVRPGEERKLRNIFFLILVDIINPLLGPRSLLIFTDIYIYIYIYSELGIIT